MLLVRVTPHAVRRYEDSESGCWLVLRILESLKDQNPGQRPGNTAISDIQPEGLKEEGGQFNPEGHSRQLKDFNEKSSKGAKSLTKGIALGYQVEVTKP